MVYYYYFFTSLDLFVYIKIGGTRQWRGKLAFATPEREQFAVVCACFSMDFNQSRFWIILVSPAIFFFFFYKLDTLISVSILPCFILFIDTHFSLFVCENIQVFGGQHYQGTTLHHSRLLGSSEPILIIMKLM